MTQVQLTQFGHQRHRRRVHRFDDVLRHIERHQFAPHVRAAYLNYKFKCKEIMKFNRMKTRVLSNRAESNKKLTMIPHPFPFFVWPFFRIPRMFQNLSRLSMTEGQNCATQRTEKWMRFKSGRVAGTWPKTQKTQRLPTSLATSKPSVLFSRLVS